MCFVHKHICKMWILGKFCADVRVQNVVTSRPMVRFRKLGMKKMRKTWKKKTPEKVCRDLRRSRGSRGFRTGGQFDPPPPS